MGLLSRTKGIVPSVIAPALGSEINAVHIHERIRRGLGVKGGNPVRALSDELVPVVIVDDVTAIEIGSSLVRRFTIFHEFTPVNNGQVLLFNPLGSGVRVQVNSVFKFNANSLQAFWRRADSTVGFAQQQAGVGGTWSHDVNGGAVAIGIGGSKSQIWNQDVAFVPTAALNWAPWAYGASNAPTQINLVLAPGQGFLVSLPIVGVTGFSDGKGGLRTLGIQRFRVREQQRETNALLVADVELIAPDNDHDLTPGHAACADLLRRVIDDLSTQRAQAEATALDANPFNAPYRLDSSVWVGNRLCEVLQVPLRAKQKLMQLEDARARLDIVTKYLRQHSVFK